MPKIEIINGKEIKIYKSILLLESDNSYLGWEPTHNPDPDLPDIGAGMYEVEWNKTLPVMNDPETGEIITYKYENGTLKAV